MNLDSLEQAVRSKLHPSDKDLVDGPYVEAAIYRTLKERPRGATDDDLCARAARVARELRDGSEEVELRRTPTDSILGDALVRALAPKIAELRESGAEFGSQRAPFASVQEAAEWIKKRSAEDLATWRLQGTERSRAHDEIDRLADKHRIELEHKSTLLPYQEPEDEHIKWTPAIPGTYLYRLAKETQRIAKRTGLPQDALVIHVLTGLKPVRSRVRITRRWSYYTLPSGEQIHVNEADVTFRALDFTDKELRAIYGTIKRHVGGKGTEALDDKDERLWTLVQDMGGPPQTHGTKGPFWRTVQEKMNLAYPDAYTTWEGVKARYNSILKRLQPPQET